jgi:hypothetical protein
LRKCRRTSFLNKFITKESMDKLDPRHSLGCVTSEWKLSWKSIDQFFMEANCLDSLAYFFRITFPHHQTYGITNALSIV